MDIHPGLQAVQHAAELIAQADSLVIAAGAGMGVDSGLPDFRGPEGLWRAYPALRGQAFHEIANPRSFDTRPELAWGFYGHRLALYRRTVPHEGFQLLRNWGERMLHGAAVFTSNVDGQMQRAGFAEATVPLVECHGSIHWMQCTTPCSDDLWPAQGFDPDVDPATCLLRNALPLCPRCGALARPNILMFGDDRWISSRTDAHESSFAEWLERVERPVVIEIGAGTSVPSVRHFSQLLLQRHGARLVRINPREWAVPMSGNVGIAAPALAALVAIDRAAGSLSPDRV